MARLTAVQFHNLCTQFGKDSFIRRPIDMLPGYSPLKNKELTNLTEWLDIHCVQPYYVTKERQGVINQTTNVVFYFMDQQDKMVFTLCFGELFN